MELEDAVAVITGAAAGIGRATAIAFAQAGVDVVVGDVDAGGAARTAADVEAAGRRALVVPVDVTDRAQVEGLVAESIGWQGHCDVFMANVGVGCHGAPHEFDPDEWRYLLDVNLMSCVWPLRLIVPHMVERRAGRLVFVTSGAGYEGHATQAPYNVAKFGIVGLAESCRAALVGTGVGVTLVVPGAIASDGWKRTVFAGGADVERRRDEMREHMARWPPPEAMGDAIVAGIRASRFYVLQENPYEPDWFANALTRKLQVDS